MITNSQRQILEAVLEALPEERVSTSKFPLNREELGYNVALQDVQAIINEFLEPEETVCQTKGCDIKEWHYHIKKSGEVIKEGEYE